jgi:hypothetical protein
MRYSSEHNEGRSLNTDHFGGHPHRSTHGRSFQRSRYCVLIFAQYRHEASSFRLNYVILRFLRQGEKRFAAAIFSLTQLTGYQLIGVAGA